jgi:hypothetical protein
MSESLAHKEAEIAATRERLAGTIDRIQDKLTVTGIIDEVLGSSATPKFEGAYDSALGIVRRNPIPVLIVAAGVGWLLQHLGRRNAAARHRLLEAELVEVPVVNDGHARIYDPDLSTAHPGAGLSGTGLNPSL